MNPQKSLYSSILYGVFSFRFINMAATVLVRLVGVLYLYGNTCMITNPPLFLDRILKKGSSSQRPTDLSWLQTFCNSFCILKSCIVLPCLIHLSGILTSQSHIWIGTVWSRAINVPLSKRFTFPLSLLLFTPLMVTGRLIESLCSASSLLCSYLKLLFLSSFGFMIDFTF